MKIKDLLMVLITLFISCQIAYSQWETPTSILVSQEGGQSSRLGKYANNIYVLVTDSSSNLKFYKSTDNGFSFDSGTIVGTNVMNGTELEMEVDTNGYIHVFWEDFTDDILYYRRSTDNGVTFSTKVPLKSGMDWADTPHCFIENSNTVYLVFRAFSTPGSELYFVKSTNAGDSFSTPIRITDNSIQEDTPKICVTNGVIFVAYLDNYSTQNLFLIRSANGGASFSEPVRVNRNERKVDFGYDMAIDRNGAILIPYKDTTNDSEGDLFVAKSVDAGNSFIYTMAADSTVRYQQFPVIFVDNNNFIYLSWYDYRLNNATNRAEIYLTKSVDGGSTYVKNFNVSNSPEDQSVRDIVVDNEIVYLLGTDLASNPFATRLYIVSALGVPVPDFFGNPVNGLAPLTVQFTDKSSGQIDSWQWNFGDGTTGIENVQQNPSHTYQSLGVYTVSLTVTGPGGSATETKSNYITVTTVEEFKVINHLMTGISLDEFKINYNNCVVPLEKREFLDTDPQAGVWFYYENGEPGNKIKWEFRKPDGSLYFEDDVDINLTSGCWYHSINIKNSAAAFVPGMWNVSVFYDGKLQFTESFSIKKTCVAPKAGLTASPMISDIIPFTVQFTNLSTGDINSWLWDFGDGNTSSQQNPSHTYTEYKNYTISLTVTGPCGSDTETKPDYIRASKPVVEPLADFIANPPTGTAPLTVNFTDLSEPNGEIESWLWSFGDGGTSSEQNPANTYRSSGFFTVSLTVSNAKGTDTETKDNYIIVTTEPIVDIFFAASPTLGNAPLTVHFVDMSFGTICAWFWEFGDGATSTEQNPVHTYNLPGIYTVSLTITTCSGLSETATKRDFIIVTGKPSESPVAEFEADPTTGFEPLTVEFTDKSIGNPTSWAWEFGNGDISSQQNPTYTYENEGIFTVTLTVGNSKGSDTEEKINLVNAKGINGCEAAFNADKTSGFVPLEVQFADKSTGNPTSWAWEFGDGDISSEQNPIHTYQICRIFSVRLTISADCGSDLFEQKNLINVQCIPKVESEFIANPTAGFVPLEVQFTNHSTGEPTSFSWKFGDGGISSEENPMHEYKTASIFTPTLLVSNEVGADIETKTNLINVQGGPLPVAEFNASPLTGFAPLKVQFTDLSQGNISNWSWSFGDGVVSSLQNPNHKYLNPGFYNAKLTVSGADGTCMENKVNLINVLEGEEPVAAFFAEPLTGNAPFTVHFFDTSSGDIASFVWDFGNGETSIVQDTLHKYENPGLFTVKLTVSNKGGTDVETKTNLIFVQDGVAPTAAFTIDDSDIEEDIHTVAFKDLSSSPDDEIIKREWDFGDGTESDEKDPEHSYTGSEGDTFTVSLTVQNADGFDTVTKPAFVKIESTIIPGFIKGRVIDKSTGAVITGAVISLSNSFDSEIASVETTTDGLYFIQLPPGDYTLSVNKEGFYEITKNVIMKESETETVNIEMSSGDGGLTVAPVTAIGTFRRLTATVTATDEDGNLVSGVPIKSSASTGAKVNPLSKKTNKDGEAKFKFKFKPGSSDGTITFTAENFEEVTITQE